MQITLVATALTLLLFATEARALGANSDSNLKRATAEQVAEIAKVRILPDSVELYEVKRGMFSVKWKARTSQGNFACEADDMLRKPYCAPIQPEGDTKVDSPTGASPGRN